MAKRKRIIRSTGIKVENGFRHPLHELAKIEMEAHGVSYDVAKAKIMMNREISAL